MIDGVEYISSKRAAELCGYAQDYVGQLARAAKIDARRASGHWYVNLESLREHTKNADARVPQTRLDVEVRAVDIITGDDGAQYVSASRASKISGYHQDYIGQLARSSTIKAQQVGNRWYVDLDMLLSHKKQKDSLLAAVQTASVGLSHQRSVYTPPTEDAVLATHYSYHKIETPLLPVTNVSPSAEVGGESDAAESEVANRVPIRVHRRVATRIQTTPAVHARRLRYMTKQILVGSVALVMIAAFSLTLSSIVPPRIDDGKASTASVSSSVQSGGSVKNGTLSQSEAPDVGDAGLIHDMLDRAHWMISDNVSYKR